VCKSGVCRTHSTTVVRTIIIWKSISFGAHEWLDAGQDGETRLHTGARVPPMNALATKRRRASRSWCVVCLHGRRVPIIDFPRTRSAYHRKRSVAEKARCATAALIFQGVFARTPFIIDRRLKRAAPPRVRDRCLFWRWVPSYVFAGLSLLRTRTRSPPPFVARWRHCGRTGYPAVGPTGPGPRLYFYFV